MNEIFDNRANALYFIDGVSDDSTFKYTTP